MEELVATTVQLDLSRQFDLKRFNLPFFTAILWSEIFELEDPRRHDNVAVEHARQQLMASGSPLQGYLFFTDIRQLPPEKFKLYPPDIDDTAVIAEALFHFGALDQGEMDKVCELLLKQWLPEKQSFFVWIPDHLGHRKADVMDPIVDINVWKTISMSPTYRELAISHLDRCLTDLSHPLTSGYYTNPDFGLWLKLRALRALYPERISKILEKNSEFLSRHTPSVQTASFSFQEPYKILEVLKHDVKRRFEDEILFEHMGLNIGYKYPGPYYNLSQAYLGRLDQPNPRNALQHSVHISG